ncbi:MAG: hypothetical protein KKC68_09125 [Candidatus Thermoplasmatota archaeon]|nr:hypothetical protein [Candidatus Thermoplasmatota archaeon]MBU1941921.1 hypothetical protein [Candidatus Thermoplasmatota archaeon]
MNSKYINLKSILSILLILAGIILYISWGVRYGVWYDIGIYSITIVLVLAGLFGFILATYFADDSKTE